jgi:hypothetical protein
VQFTVSTQGLTWLVSDAPVQRLDYETKALKTTEDGQPVYGVMLLAMDGKDSAPIRVRMEGDPGVSQGQMVKPVGLALNQIARAGEVMSWWTAERLEPVGPPPPAVREGQEGQRPKAAR